MHLFHLIRRCFKTQSFLAFSFNYCFFEILLLFQISLLFFSFRLFFLFLRALSKAGLGLLQASEESFEVLGPWRDSKRCCTVHIEFEKFSSFGKKKVLDVTFYVSSSARSV